MASSVFRPHSGMNPKNTPTETPTAIARGFISKVSQALQLFSKPTVDGRHQDRAGSGINLIALSCLTVEASKML
jgi:hypothetical protein